PCPRHSDEVGAAEPGPVAPPAQIVARAEPHGLDPVRLCRERDQALEQPGRLLIAGGEEAVDLVAEELVERIARDTRSRDNGRDGRPFVAALGDDLEHRVYESLALGRPHVVRRELVPAARERFEAVLLDI